MFTSVKKKEKYAAENIMITRMSDTEHYDCRCQNTYKYKINYCVMLVLLNVLTVKVCVHLYISMNNHLLLQ